MTSKQILRLGSNLRDLVCVVFAVALAPRLLLLNADENLPGKPSAPVKSQTWVCGDCDARVVPVRAQDGSLKCPNEPTGNSHPSHALSAR